MSVDFQTRLNEPVRTDECVEETSMILAQLFGQLLAPRIVEVRSGKDAFLDVPAVIERGLSDQVFTIAIADDALLSVVIINVEDPSTTDENLARGSRPWDRGA